jgi:transcriptional regulator of acetoin/glycerol metabolism
MSGEQLLESVAEQLGQEDFLRKLEELLAKNMSQRNAQHRQRWSKVGPEPGSQDERALLMDTLRRNGSNVSAAGRELGVSRVTLYRMMERNHLSLEWRVSIRYSPPKLR